MAVNSMVLFPCLDSLLCGCFLRSSFLFCSRLLYSNFVYFWFQYHWCSSISSCVWRSLSIHTSEGGDTAEHAAWLLLQGDQAVSLQNPWSQWLWLFPLRLVMFFREGVFVQSLARRVLVWPVIFLEWRWRRGLGSQCADAWSCVPYGMLSVPKTLIWPSIVKIPASGRGSIQVHRTEEGVELRGIIRFLDGPLLFPHLGRILLSLLATFMYYCCFFYYIFPSSFSLGFVS